MIHYSRAETLNGVQKFSRVFAEGSVRPLGNWNGRMFGFSTQYQRGNGMSLHRNKDQALFGAMGEAIERHCTTIERPDFKSVTFLGLRDQGLPALDPAEFKIFDEDQGAVRRGEVYNLRRDSVTDWAWFESTAGKVLLPFNFSGSAPSGAPVYFMPSTNGNACAGDPAHARLSAALELIERDAVLFYWWTKNAPRPLLLTGPDARLSEILQPFRPVLDRVKLFFLQTELEIPIVLAVIRGDFSKHGYRFGVSAAAHLDPIRAIDRALSEVTQLENIMQTKAPAWAREVRYEEDFELSVWDFVDHFYLYAFQPMEAAMAPLLAGTSPLSWRDLPMGGNGGAEAGLAYIQNEFDKNRLRLYFRELSDRALRYAGFSVYRAFSPDLIAIDAAHRHRPFGYPRLFQLPEKLGLKQRPGSMRDLNPFPHPFP